MKKISVLYWWIASYILMLAMLVFFYLTMEYLSTRQLVEEYKGITATLQEQVSDTLQSYFEEIQKSAVELCNDSMLVSYALSAQPQGANYYNTVLIQQRLCNQMLLSKEEIEVYLYLKNIDKAISSDTIYSRETFMEELGSYFWIEEAEYDTMLSENSVNQIKTLDAKNGEGKAVVILTSIPMTGASVRGMYVQVVDNQVLDRVLERAVVLADSTVILLDGTGEILCASGDVGVADQVTVAALAGIRNSELEINGEKYWADWKEMTDEDWRLVTLIPMSSIEAKTNWVSHMMLPVLGIALLIGVVLTIFSIYINYRPLHRLYQNFEGKSKRFDSKNEYERLNMAFHDMYEDIETMRVLQNEQAELLKVEFLRSCIESNTDIKESNIRPIIEKLGVEISEAPFLVGLFEVNTGEVDEQVLSVCDKADILTEFFEETDICAYGSFYLLTPHRQLVLLYYLNDAAKEKEFKKLCKAKLLKLVQQYHWEMIFAFSMLHQDLSELHLAWLEARELLDYKHSKNHSGISEEMEEVGISQYGQISYSGVQEELLMRYVIAGNITDAQELLKLIYQHNFEEQFISFPVACVLMEDIVIGMMKALSQKGILDEEITEKLDFGLEQIRHATSREQLIELVNRLTEEVAFICSRYKEKSTDTRNIQIEKIMDCVEEHFRECDFNVSKAAECLNMNMTYLSRYFKEHTGIGLLNYINGVRINYAKKLMQERNITVAEVAGLAGFENQNTFIRLFKKFEGKTPGLFMQ